MKRGLIVYLVACSVLVAALVGASGAVNILAINSNTSGSEATITPQQYTCWVSDYIMGPAITSIRASRYVENTYWVNFHHGAAMNHNLKFIIKFMGVGARCVVKQETQLLKFPYPGYGSGAYSNVPFAVIDWGGGVQWGPAYVVPVVDGVTQWANRYWFTVTG